MGVYNMATVTIKELYDILTANNIDASEYVITAKDLDDNTQTIISGENTIDYIKRKYGTRRYSILKGQAVDDAEAQSDFQEAFHLWIVNRQHNIDKQYQALFDYDYSPIENVDRYETETTLTDNDTTYGKTTTHGGTDTETHSGNDVTTYSNDSETNKTGTETTARNLTNETNENKKAGFNAPNTYTPSEQNTHTINNDRNVTTYDTTDTLNESSTNTLAHGESIRNQYGETIANSGKDNFDGTTNRTLRVHGNIGVTTNNQLIDAELEMRKFSLAEMLIDNFINDYTFYS